MDDLEGEDRYDGKLESGTREGKLDRILEKCCIDQIGAGQAGWKYYGN